MVNLNILVNEFISLIAINIDLHNHRRGLPQILPHK